MLIKKLSQLINSINQDVSQNQQNQLLNPMQYINPYYTHQQTQNDLSPMQMYQQYKQTGTIPQYQSQFMPFQQPSELSQPLQQLINSAPSSRPSITQTGGK